MSTPDLVTSADDLVGSASATLLAKHVADVLTRNYPGWLWTVDVDAPQGVLNIGSLLLHSDLRYTLKLRRVQEDPDLKCVMRAAGMFLEACGFKRGRYEPDAYARARKDYRGNCIVDSSVLTARDRREIRGKNIKQEVLDGNAVIFTDDRIGAALAARNVQ